MSGLKPSTRCPAKVPRVTRAARLASATGSDSVGKSQAMTWSPARCACGSSRLRKRAPYQPEVLPPVRIQSWCSPAARAWATTCAKSMRVSAQVVSHIPLPRTGSTLERCGVTATGAGSDAVRIAGFGAWNGGPGGNGGGGQGCG